MSESIQTVNPFAASEAVDIPLTAGVAAAQSREMHELQTLFTVAHSVGRDRAKAWDELMLTCQRPGFAAGAEYRFPRGGNDITGPSVKLAREAARCWGWIVYDIRIVADVGDERHIRGVALDLISGVRVAVEDHFKKLVQRKRGGDTQWVEPDERDLRELTYRRGAICVRNAILQVLPPDMIEVALDTSRRFQIGKAAEDLKKDRRGVIQALVQAYNRFNVTEEQLVEHIDGRPLAEIVPDELCDLRAIWTSIKDGNTSAASHFGRSAIRTAETEALDKALAGPSAPEAGIDFNTAPAQTPAPPPVAAPAPAAAPVAPQAVAPVAQPVASTSATRTIVVPESITAITDKKELLEGCEQLEARMKWVGKKALDARQLVLKNPNLNRADISGLQHYMAYLLTTAEQQG